MVRRLRVWASRCLLLLLCASLFTASFESFHHTGVDGGAEWLGALEVHDASAHRIGAGAEIPADEGEPCFICQWARAFRLAPGSGRRVLASQVGVSSRFVHTAAPLAAAPDLSNLPARAPPQFS